MRRRRDALLALMTGFVAGGGLIGCTVGPNYQKPQVATPGVYGDAASAGQPLVLQTEPDLSAWWTIFNDPKLNDLIGRALKDNPDLQSAASRVREARQQEREAGAAEWPVISGSGNAVTYNSNRNSAAGLPSGSSSGASSASPSGGLAGLPIPSHFNLYSAGFDASWEVDIFGGVRRSVERAKATTAAAEWASRDGQVSLIAEVAKDYLTLRALQARTALGHAELQRQQDLFALIRDRRRAGFITNLDVNQQTVQVATAAAQLPQLDAQARVQIHALGVLIGQPPETLIAALSASPSTALPAPPPALPVGLPSDLLERRPDVREAERRLAAANADVGVQEAGLYPRVNLLGLASFASMSTSDLFSRQNLSSAGVGMLTVPLFDAGKTRAEIAAAKEEKLQAEAAYRSTVFGAFRDVEDALTRYSAENKRRASLNQSVTAARNTLAIAQDQYKAGLVTFINVLQAETSLLSSQDHLVQSDATTLSDLISIYKALGGGWST